MNKTIKALAAICASAMLLSTSAFAANTPAVSDVTDLAGFAVSFDADNKLTVTAPDAAIATEQMTLLVVDSAATTISEDDIIYINQQAVSEGDFEGVGMISTWLTKEDAAGKVYDLKLGYYWDNDADSATAPAFAIATAKVTVSADAQTMTVLYGDVNDSGAVDAIDASLIVKKRAGSITNFTKGTVILPETLGDVNGSGAVDAIDASLVIKKRAGSITNFTDKDGNILDKLTFTPASN